MMMSDFSDYKSFKYTRVDVNNESITELVRSALDLNEGDIKQLVFDGKIIPVVSLNAQKIYKFNVPDYTLGAGLSQSVFGVLYTNIPDDYRPYFTYVMTIVLERGTDCNIAYGNSFLKLAADTNTVFNCSGNAWDQSPVIENTGVADMVVNISGYGWYDLEDA